MPSKEKRIGTANKVMEIIREKLTEQANRESEEKAAEDLAKARGRQNGEEYSLDEESESDDSYGGVCKKPKVEEDPVEIYRSFIMALPECPMNLGFHVGREYPDEDKCCFCPCGLKLKLWREKFLLGGHTCETRGNQPGKFAPSGLIDHLEQFWNPERLAGTLKRPCIYHEIVYTYLVNLYADYWGAGLSHRAFYKMNDAEWRRAEAAERKVQQR